MGGEEQGGREAVRHQLICDNEAVASHQRHIMGRFEQLVAENVAVDLGDAPGDLRPKLVAAAAVAALMAMQPEDKSKHQKGVDAESLAQLDDAFAFLRGGIAALQERRASFG